MPFYHSFHLPPGPFGVTVQDLIVTKVDTPSLTPLRVRDEIVFLNGVDLRPLDEWQRLRLLCGARDHSKTVAVLRPAPSDVAPHSYLSTHHQHTNMATQQYIRLQREQRMRLLQQMELVQIQQQYFNPQQQLQTTFAAGAGPTWNYPDSAGMGDTTAGFSVQQQQIIPPPLMSGHRNKGTNVPSNAKMKTKGTAITRKPRGKKRKNTEQSSGSKCEEPPNQRAVHHSDGGNDSAVVEKGGVLTDNNTKILKDNGSLEDEGAMAAERAEGATAAPTDSHPIMVSQTVKEEDRSETKSAAYSGRTSNDRRRSRRLGNGSSHDEAITTLNGIGRKPKSNYTRPRPKVGRKIRVGDVGYKFRKRFHAGWFSGKVVQIRPGASESISFFSLHFCFWH